MEGTYIFQQEESSSYLDIYDSFQSFPDQVDEIDLVDPKVINKEISKAIEIE